MFVRAFLIAMLSVTAFGANYKKFADPKTGIEWRQVVPGAVSVSTLTNTITRYCLEIPAPPADFRGFQPLVSVAYESTMAGVTETLPSLQKNHRHFRTRLQRVNEALDHGLVVEGTDLIWLFLDNVKIANQHSFRGVALHKNTRKLSEFYATAGSWNGISTSDLKRIVTQNLAAVFCYKK